MAGSADNETVTTGCICEIRLEFLGRHEIVVVQKTGLCELLTNHQT